MAVHAEHVGLTVVGGQTHPPTRLLLSWLVMADPHCAESGRVTNLHAAFRKACITFFSGINQHADEIARFMNADFECA